VGQGIGANIKPFALCRRLRFAQFLADLRRQEGSIGNEPSSGLSEMRVCGRTGAPYPARRSRGGARDPNDPNSAHDLGRSSNSLAITPTARRTGRDQLMVSCCWQARPDLRPADLPPDRGHAQRLPRSPLAMVCECCHLVGLPCRQVARLPSRMTLSDSRLWANCAQLVSYGGPFGGTVRPNAHQYRLAPLYDRAEAFAPHRCRAAVRARSFGPSFGPAREHATPFASLTAAAMRHVSPQTSLAMVLRSAVL